MTQELLAQVFAGDMPAPDPYAHETFSVVSHDGYTVVENVSHAVAMRVKQDYKEMFGGKYDIIETSTVLKDGTEIFSGTPETFSHVPSHVSSHETYDVQIDGHIIAHDLTEEAKEDFIRETVDILDIFSAIAEAVATAEFSLDDILHTLDTMSRDMFYGATTIKYSSPETSAPMPARSETDWRTTAARRKVSRGTTGKIVEYRPLTVPAHMREWTIMDTRTLLPRYAGTKETCLDYLHQMKSNGIKMHEMKVVRTENIADYISEVRANGVRVIVRGESKFVGLEADAKNFVAAILRPHNDKKLFAKNIRVERI